ncbi:Uncharacterised protein [uncultured archaeon]|nr:Uncharacterised protein [uncultured archaeon]
MCLARSLEIHVNTIMRHAHVKHFSNNDLQHPSPKSVKPIRLTNDLRFALIKRSCFCVLQLFQTCRTRLREIYISNPICFVVTPFCFYRVIQ